MENKVTKKDFKNDQFWFDIEYQCEECRNILSTNGKYHFCVIMGCKMYDVGVIVKPKNQRTDGK